MFFTRQRRHIRIYYILYYIRIQQCLKSVELLIVLVITKCNPNVLRMIINLIFKHILRLLNFSPFLTGCWTMWCVTIAQSDGGASWQPFWSRHCDALTWWPVLKTILCIAWSCWVEVRTYTEAVCKLAFSMGNSLDFFYLMWHLL